MACHVSPARPQPRLRVDRAGERVGDGVEVGADVQPVQHEVVADVDDGGDLGGAAHLHQPGQQPAAPTPPARTVIISGTLGDDGRCSHTSRTVRE